MNNLTKRQYFAACALTGLTSSAEYSELEIDTNAHIAVRQADKLIETLALIPDPNETTRS